MYYNCNVYDLFVNGGNTSKQWTSELYSSNVFLCPESYKSTKNIFYQLKLRGVYTSWEKYILLFLVGGGYNSKLKWGQAQFFLTCIQKKNPMSKIEFQPASSCYLQKCKSYILCYFLPKIVLM